MRRVGGCAALPQDPGDRWVLCRAEGMGREGSLGFARLRGWSEGSSYRPDEGGDGRLLTRTMDGCESENSVVEWFDGGGG